MSAKRQKGSKKARLSAARLAAVQAVYQIVADDRKALAAARDYLDHYAGMEIDGNALLAPEKELFSAIVQGVGDRRDDLETLLEVNLGSGGDPSDKKEKKTDHILKSILLCGAYELLAHPETDAPVIIADYLNVTHAFYEGRESSLVNGVLDSIRKVVRA